MMRIIIAAIAASCGVAVDNFHNVSVEGCVMFAAALVCLALAVRR